MQYWKIFLFSRLAGMWRYRWWGLGVTWTVCLLGWLVIFAIPNKYESAAKVYIDTDTVMRPLMAGMTITPNIDQEVDVMMRTLVTRPNIEQVAKLSDPSLAHASQAQLAARADAIQKNITLRPLDTKNLFNIAYTNSDPAMAQSVTQSLVSLLVNSNIGSERRNVSGVESFLDQQIAGYEKQLRDMEKRRADFQTANMEYLSGVNGDASVMIDKAHAELLDAENQLGIEMARRDSISAQLHSVSPTMRVEAAPPMVFNNGSASGGSQDLEQAQSALNNLQARFTDKHPDVIAARQLVERLKKQASTPGGGGSSYNGHQGVPNPVYINLQSKLADAQTNVVLQQRRVAQATANELRARNDMAQAQTVARQYHDLDRDYDVIHKNYQDLLSRREAARLSRAVGDQESDTIFRVIEPPRKPDAPVSPNRMMLNSVILALGIAAGIVTTFALYLNEDSFAVSDELLEAFGLPVLGSVSRVNAVSQQLEMRHSVVMMTSGLAILASLYGVLILISQWHVF
jgi:polysaccharide chain length determinant protein (PEP-CTERM system associated)